MEDTSTVRVAGIIRESIVDGPGIRFVLFAQGCPHHCKNCHNPASWDFDAGKDYSVSTLFEEIMKNPLLDGITLSGGEPFCQSKPLTELARKAKEQNLTVMTYTGYTFEELLAKNDPDVMALLETSDWLVDGLYMEELRSLEIRFRGSSNQRILDVSKSLSANATILSPLHEPLH